MMTEIKNTIASLFLALLTVAKKNDSSTTHQLTHVSKNIKTGEIPVSRSSRSTCPIVCPLRGSGGCYGEGGNCRFHWDRVDASAYNSVSNWSSFCQSVAEMDPDSVTIWRHNELGDLRPEQDNPDRICAESAAMLCQANSVGANRGGFTYTHHDVLGETGEENAAHNRTVIQAMNESGFTVNLSADNLAEVDALAELEIAPVVCVLPMGTDKPVKTPAGRTVGICPATVRDDVTCATCKLCQRQRKGVIGFPAHGARKAKLSAALSAGE